MTGIYQNIDAPTAPLEDRSNDATSSRKDTMATSSVFDPLDKTGLDTKPDASTEKALASETPTAPVPQDATPPGYFWVKVKGFYYANTPVGAPVQLLGEMYCQILMSLTTTCKSFLRNFVKAALEVHMPPSPWGEDQRFRAKSITMEFRRTKFLKRRKGERIVMEDDGVGWEEFVRKVKESKEREVDVMYWMEPAEGGVSEKPKVADV